MDGTTGRRAVQFRTERFEEITDDMGHRSTAAKARLVGCGLATMSRMRNGKQRPGNKFIADVLAALPDYSYTDFFYEGEEASEPVRAAA